MIGYYSWKVCAYLHFEVRRHLVFGGMSTSFFFGVLTSLSFVEIWSFTDNWLDTLLWGTLTWTDDCLLFWKVCAYLHFEVCRHPYFLVCWYPYFLVCWHPYFLACWHFYRLMKHDLLLIIDWILCYEEM